MICHSPTMRRCAKPSAAVKILLAAILCVTWAHAQSPFALRDGDRVIFYGDSITEPRLYTAFIETYALTRFPTYRLEFRNSAWGGDRVTGGRGGPIDVRLQRDVITYRPTVFALMLGINDGRGEQFDPKLYAQFSTGYEHIVAVLRDALPGLRITVMKPSPYDEVTRPPAFGGGGYNGVMIRYGQFVEDFGFRNGLTVADLNAPLVSVLVAAEAEDHALAKQIAGDGTHPGVAGHLVLAEALLKAWHSPALVSSVEIDAGAKRIARAENTHIANLQIGSSLSWSELDNALPFPIDLDDPATKLAVRCSGFAEALDEQLVKVTGVKAQRYALAVDGERIAVLGREELEQGVNLALLDTPMSRQAHKVHDLTIKRNQVQFGRWRQVQAALEGESPPHKGAVLDALEAVEQDLLEQQRRAAVPMVHHFELQPQ